VVVAVATLVDVPGLVKLWRHDRRDGWTALGTFVAVLALGVETGIGVGVALALLLRALPRPASVESGPPPTDSPAGPRPAGPVPE
jgi:SulP family sulfate permease